MIYLETNRKPVSSARRIHPGYYHYRGMSIERIGTQFCWLVFKSTTISGRVSRHQMGRFSTLVNAKLYVDWKLDCK